MSVQINVKKERQLKKHGSCVGVFGPTETFLMKEALERSWRMIAGGRECSKTDIAITKMREDIAKRIICLAERGEFDPRRLAELATKSITLSCLTERDLRRPVGLLEGYEQGIRGSRS